MPRFVIPLIIFSVAFVLIGCAEQSEPEEEEWILELPPAKETAGFTSYPIESTDDGTFVLPIFRFEGDDEIGRFVYGNVNVYIEQAADPEVDGNHIAEATFFRSVKAEGKRLYFYMLMHPLRGRYADWSASDEFSFFIRNTNDFDATIHIEINDDEEGSFEKEIGLDSGIGQTIVLTMDELTDAGVDASKIKRVTFWLIDEELPDIATFHFDDFSLAGSDEDALQAAKDKAEAKSEMQLEAIGGGKKADYLPRIVDNVETINEVVTRFNPGPIHGVVKADVVVVGGGMSGCSAAIAASKAGADVILIEAYGFLGGMATAGMVFPFMSNRAGDEDIIEGIFLEMYERMAAEGLAKRDKHDPGIIWFDKEELKYVLQEMCIDAGVKLMLHTWAEAPLQEEAKGEGIEEGVERNEPRKGKVEGVVVGNKSGRIAVLGDVTIDCTGDGDIAAGAGCPYEKGRGYDPYTQSVTLFFRMGNVNTNKAFGELYKRVWRSEDYIPAEFLFADKFKEAKEKGDLDKDLPINVVYFERTLSPGVVSINATRVFKVDATNVVDLSYAEVEARRQVHQLSRFLQKYIPGCERAFLQESAIHIGVRESRRILGEYQLTGHDVLSAKKSDDVIARGAFGIDLHCADFSGCGVVGLELERGKSYDIPYGCLVPLEVDGVMVAGRCISATHVALGSARIMPVASATGQAAGAAAALCVKEGIAPRELDVTKLQELLIDQGANLGR